MAERAVHHWNGRFTEVTMVRYLNDVLLRRGDDAWSVNQEIPRSLLRGYLIKGRV